MFSLHNGLEDEYKVELASFCETNRVNYLSEIRLLWISLLNFQSLPISNLKGHSHEYFADFLVKTVLKLSVANFVHTQHCV